MTLRPILRLAAATLLLAAATPDADTHAATAATERLTGRTVEATAAATRTATRTTEAADSTEADAHLLIGAADAIGSLARDAVTVGHIRAAAHLVPGLDAYAALRASGRLDRADSLRLAALRACADVAGTRLAAHPEARARALYQLALIQANLSDTACLATIDAAIRAARRAGGIGRGGEADEALLRYELARLYLHWSTGEGDTPLRFGPLLHLEKRALALLPHRPESLAKAEILYYLAVLKDYTAFPDELAQAADSILPPDSVATVAPYAYHPGTELTTNSLHYYRTSFALYRRLLGTGHPDLVSPWVDYVWAYVGIEEGEKLLSAADSIVNLADVSFAENHPLRTDVRVLRDRLSQLHGLPRRYTGQLADLLHHYRDYYGADSPSYLNLLVLAALSLQNDKPGQGQSAAFKALDAEYSATAPHTYAHDAGQYLLDELNFLTAYEQADVQAFKEKLAALTALATDSAQAPSWRRVQAVRQLIPKAFDNGQKADAARLARRCVDDITALAGGKALPTLAVAHYDLAGYLEHTPATADEIMTEYERSIRLHERAGSTSAMTRLDYARYLGGTDRWAEAKEQLVMLAAQDELKANPVDEAFVRLALMRAMISVEPVDTDSVWALYDAAVPLFTADTTAVNAITVKGYMYISNVFTYFGLHDRARLTLEDGWSLVTQVCPPAAALRTEFYNELYGCYFALGCDNEAERLTDEEMAAIIAAGKQGSETYLELLWNRYLVVNWRTPDDFAKNATLLMEQFTAITERYQRTGQAQDVLYNYGLRVINATIDMMATIAFETADTSGYAFATPDMRTNMHKSKAGFDATVRQLGETFIPMLHQLEAGYPAYTAPTDYRLHPGYTTLLRAFSNWYSTLQPDSARERHYIELEAECYRLQERPWDADWRLALYYIGTGEMEKAYELASDCHNAPERFSPLRQLQICQSFGQVAWLLGHEDEAVRAAVEQAGHIRRYVRGNFDFLSSGERAEFLTTYGNSGAAITAHLDRRPAELAAEAYDAALFDKGLLLHSWERLRRAILRSGDSLLAARLDTLDLLRKQQRHTAIVPLDSSAMRKQVGLMQRMEGIEKTLARQAAQFRPDTMRVASWREVQARLAADEAAIEFTFADTALAALVVRPGMERPRYVRLGSSQACYDLLHRSERLPADTRVRRLYTYGRTPLYDLVWRPIEAELRGVRRVYYSPIAMLHRVAFAALPVGPDSCLVDRYDLCPLSTTAELLRPRREEAVRTAALFGGVHYSPGQGVTAATGTATEETEAATGKTGSRQRAALEEEFDYLSETLAETEAIARTMEAAGLSPLTFKGEKATEPAFYTLDGQSPDVIHLATHGFYINADDVENNAFLMNHPGSRTQSMQRTGLAFAGANATWRGLRRNDREDGILTANELSLLDLSRTKLAVLSACETALGDYSTEGVWGLQRGFKEAGVGTLILSLWNVNDRATALFMQAFYDQWLNGKPKRAAFIHAVDTLRRSHPNPFFWAAFVLLDAND